jgi:hypothetical protein
VPRRAVDDELGFPSVASPGWLTSTSTGDVPMPDYQQLRGERETIDTAARALRSTAIADGYAGLQHKAVAFGFALILDELSRHWAQMSDEVRRAALDCYTALAAGSRRQ